MAHILTGADVFDGERLHRDLAVVIEAGRIARLIPAVEAGPGAERITGLLAPAFVDLQVNGGGGHQISGATTVSDLAQVCATHRQLGCAGVLPTLITDRPEATDAVVAAGIAAAKARVPGFLGLHLEGPHLDPRRKGAHDPGLIRPMTDTDLARLCEAARALPALLVTLAPEAATPMQIAALTQAGVIVSLGHSDCSQAEACAAIAAGAQCATHLFNAMSQLGNREPGLVGAILGGMLAAGIIADGIHVHPDVLRIALAARRDGIFLVTDCMAFAGTELAEMNLGGRPVLRGEGRLRLADGTLAGADLTMAGALRVLTGPVGIAPERALAMASLIPARLIGQSNRLGRIAPGYLPELVLLSDRWTLTGAWGADPSAPDGVVRHMS
ncbi:MAG: N-acetylglucosamine-6-phosphate deacetylase [Pseudorhodobacter sp.]